MYFQAFAKLATIVLCSTHAFGLDFFNAEWIWTNDVDLNGNAPAGSRAFRRDYYSQQNQSALSAEIAITADNAYTLFVNGELIGSGTGVQGGSTTQVKADAYCIRLVPECNTFAVNVTNAPGSASPAGLLAVIQLQYNDGFSDTIVTDSNWHAFTSVPDGFEQTSFDDSAWPRATVVANYGGPPWGTVGSPLLASTTLTAPQLTDANWIWTNEVDSKMSAPKGARAFRKNVVLPNGQTASSASFVIGTDDQYTLYVNGLVVGSGTHYTRAERYVVDFNPPVSDILLAVYAVNTGLWAGVIATMEVQMTDCDCGPAVSIVTDSSWKYSLTTPTGFELPGFDDSAWPNAIGEGLYGVKPWGNLTVATTASPASSPIKSAPAEPTADVVA